MAACATFLAPFHPWCAHQMLANLFYAASTCYPPADQLTTHVNVPPCTCMTIVYFQENVYDFLNPKQRGGRRLQQTFYPDGIIPGVIRFAGVGTGYDSVSKGL